MKAKQCHEVTSDHINHCKKQDFWHVLILQTSLGTWCSCYHYWNSWFNRASVLFLCKYKSYLWCVGGLWWWKHVDSGHTWKLSLMNFHWFRSSRPEASCKKRCFRNFTKFSGKNLCQSLFLTKAAEKKETLAQVFSCKFFEVSKKIFLHRTSLLSVFIV